MFFMCIIISGELLGQTKENFKRSFDDEDSDESKKWKTLWDFLKLFECTHYKFKLKTKFSLSLRLHHVVTRLLVIVSAFVKKRDNLDDSIQKSKS